MIIVVGMFWGFLRLFRLSTTILVLIIYAEFIFIEFAIIICPVVWVISQVGVIFGIRVISQATIIIWPKP